MSSNNKAEGISAMKAVKVVGEMHHFRFNVTYDAIFNSGETVLQGCVVISQQFALSLSLKLNMDCCFLLDLSSFGQ